MCCLVVEAIVRGYRKHPRLNLCNQNLANIRDPNCNSLHPGGMPVGREGPMIHAAAIMAAGVSQGMSTSIPGRSCRLASFAPCHQHIDRHLT